MPIRNELTVLGVPESRGRRGPALLLDVEGLNFMFEAMHSKMAAPSDLKSSRSTPYPEPGSAAEDSPDRDPGRMSAIADARATLRRAALVGSREHVGTAPGPASTRSEGLMTVQAFKVDDQSAQVKQSG